MNEDTHDLIERVRVAIWSGFETPAEVHELIDDLLDGDADEAVVRASVEPEFARKAAEEATWPEVTDCDRLDLAFERLDANGIVALQNAGDTMSDGHSDVAEVWAEAGRIQYHGYCFYHGQDVERAVNGGGLMIACGAFDDSRDAQWKAGQFIQQVFEDVGFFVRWYGGPGTRMELPSLEWKRRSPTL
ncbi:MAG: hypothetical protein Rubg2KO_00240 [Rubricoccaceae bacterium]